MVLKYLGIGTTERVEHCDMLWEEYGGGIVREYGFCDGVVGLLLGLGVGWGYMGRIGSIENSSDLGVVVKLISEVGTMVWCRWVGEMAEWGSGGELVVLLSKR